jgi:hypothetical protein
MQDETLAGRERLCYCKSTSKEHSGTITLLLLLVSILGVKGKILIGIWIHNNSEKQKKNEEL